MLDKIFRTCEGVSCSKSHLHICTHTEHVYKREGKFTMRHSDGWAQNVRKFVCPENVWMGVHGIQGKEKRIRKNEKRLRDLLF